MVALLEPHLFWGVLLIQLAGFASMACARLSEGSRVQRGCQRMFLICLCLVGVTTMLAVSHGSSCWWSCGTTLSLMAVGATLDMNSHRRVETTF